MASIQLPCHRSLEDGTQCVIYDTKRNTLDTYEVVLSLLTGDPSPVEYTTILRLGPTTRVRGLDSTAAAKDSETQSSSEAVLEVQDQDPEQKDPPQRLVRKKAKPKSTHGYTHLLIEAVGSRVKRVVLCTKDTCKRKGQVLFDSESATTLLATSALHTAVFPSPGSQVRSILCLLQEVTLEKIRQLETPRIELVVKEHHATVVLHSPARLFREAVSPCKGIGHLSEVSRTLNTRRKEFCVKRMRIAKGGAGLYLSAP